MQSVVLFRRIVTELIVFQANMAFQGGVWAVEATAMLMRAVVTLNDIFRTPALALLQLLLLPLLQPSHVLKQLHHHRLLLLSLFHCALQLSLSFQKFQLFQGWEKWGVRVWKTWKTRVLVTIWWVFVNEKFAPFASFGIVMEGLHCVLKKNKSNNAAFH